MLFYNKHNKIFMKLCLSWKTCVKCKLFNYSIDIRNRKINLNLKKNKYKYLLTPIYVLLYDILNN